MYHLDALKIKLFTIHLKFQLVMIKRAFYKTNVFYLSFTLDINKQLSKDLFYIIS